MTHDKMLVKFFHRGTATSESALAYLLSEAPMKYLAGSRDRRGVVRDPAPAVVKGHADLVRNLINHCRNRHRYTSGVLSFERMIPEKHEAEIIRKFEGVAFAGLREHQYSCLWIRHAHLQRTELHFLVPRTELITLKALNINPPGFRKEGMYDVFRKLVNDEYGLKDPSGGVLTPAERTRLEQKLASLVSARAAYNRSRYHEPEADQVLTPLRYEDRTEPLGRGVATPERAVRAARPGYHRALDRIGVATRTLGEACGRGEQIRGGGGRGIDPVARPAVERFDRAVGGIGRASRQLEQSGAALGRATQSYRLAAQERQAVNEGIFAKYGIPQPVVARVGLEREVMERDLAEER
ncbi:MAG: hypothetical protein KGS61_05185 [Verrucomicrobia bacterium]|nr:hypothetical protein [Verrucomicrobiota bacterium]